MYALYALCTRKVLKICQRNYEKGRIVRIVRILLLFNKIYKYRIHRGKCVFPTE